MNYCEKYDKYNPGMKEVFDRMYGAISDHGIKSNMVAACGEDLVRYLTYAANAVTIHTKKGQVILVEQNRARYNNLKSELEKLKYPIGIIGKAALRTTILHGNILTYEDIPGFPLKNPARIEDLGLGIRFDKLIRKAIGRLDTQRENYTVSRRSGKYFKKAQILDGSRKYVSDQRCFRLLQQYFSILDASLGGINGVLPSSRMSDEETSDFIFRCGKSLGIYEDNITGHKCRVFEHEVEFIDPGRIVDVKLYTYINGGSMLSCVVVYR